MINENEKLSLIKNKDSGMRDYSHSSFTFFNKDKTEIIAEYNDILDMLGKVSNEDKDIVVLVIHHNDLDGESSAYLISRYLKEYLKDKNLTFFYQSYNYQPSIGGKPSVIETSLEEVISSNQDKVILSVVVDLSLTKDLLEVIMKTLYKSSNPYFLWIDHHISSLSVIRNRWKSNTAKIDLLYNIPIGYLYDSRDSACYLINSFFETVVDININDLLPMLISIYDTKNIKEFSTIYQSISLPLNTAYREMINNFPIDSDFWNSIFQVTEHIYLKGKSPLEQFIDTGRNLLELQELKNSIIYNEDLVMIYNKEEFVVKGLLGNASVNLFDKDMDFGRKKAFGIFISYIRKTDLKSPKTIRVSITSNKLVSELDLGYIARERFNGGGHKHICGFTIQIQSLDDLKQLFKDCYSEDEISLNKPSNCIIKKDKTCSIIFSSLCKVLEKYLYKATNK